MISQVILIGLPGSGKTVTAKSLANLMGLPRCDVDAEIEAAEGRTVSEIFATEGEAEFRRLEVAATLATLERRGVISLGGGAITSPEIREALIGRVVVWLRTTVYQVLQRIGVAIDRPLLVEDPSARMLELSLARSPLYAECATHVVDTDSLRPSEVAELILEELEADLTQPMPPVVIDVAGEHPYHVAVGSGVYRQLISHLSDATRVAVIYTAAVREQAQAVESVLTHARISVFRIEVPVGEEGKSASTLTRCWELLAENGFTRSDLIIGVGGGATTDLAGFVAATYLRGIDFITVPTSLLAMVDAAVGGKTGIDLAAGKNLVGAFHEPRAVLADLDFLAGLPLGEVRSGLAEVIKVGFTDDPKILELIEDHPEAALDVTSSVCAELIQRAIEVKARVVSRDLRESTSVGSQVGRERLNYGHTYGHALEANSGYELRHGEAVALGAVFAAELANRLGYLSAERVAHHRELFERMGLPTTHVQDDWRQLSSLMSRDKKARGNQLRFVVVDDESVVRIEVVEDDDLLQAIHLGLLG